MIQNLNDEKLFKLVEEYFGGTHYAVGDMVLHNETGHCHSAYLYRAFAQEVIDMALGDLVLDAERVTQADMWDEEREKLLRALYDRGYEDRAKERDYDPLGASEFDAAMCAPRAGAARAKQADALDAESWVSESDSKPHEYDGEVFVRFSDGTFGTGWVAYWHGASNDFDQWCHPDPDEDRTVTHWMKPPTIAAAIAAAKENK